MAKLLKNTSGQAIQLYLGKQDATNILIEADELLNYSDLVVEDISNPNYNKPLIDSYIASGIFTELGGVQAGVVLEPEVDPVIVNFSPSNRLKLYVNDSIQLQDLTTGTPVAWSWGISFLGDNPPVNPITYLTGTATSQNPVIKFLYSGLYSISLTVTQNTGEIKSHTKVAVIQIIDIPTIIMPIANFTVTGTLVTEPDSFASTNTITLHDTSTNSPTSWFWTITKVGGVAAGVTFVNGTNNTSQNPQISITETGAYNISLAASNAAGSSVVVKQNVINVVNSIPTASYSITASTGNVTNSSKTFTSNSTGNGITYYKWSVTRNSVKLTEVSNAIQLLGNTTFGTSTLQLKFLLTGTYQISLQVANDTALSSKYTGSSIIISGGA